MRPSGGGACAPRTQLDVGMSPSLEEYKKSLQGWICFFLPIPHQATSTSRMTAVARSTDPLPAPATGAPADTTAPSLLTLSKGAHVLHYPDWSGPTSTAATRARFLDALRISMSSVGFFYLDASPLEPLRERLFEVNRRFFALPLETRMTIRMEESPHFRGYSPFGAERTQGQVDHRDQVGIASRQG